MPTPTPREPPVGLIGYGRMGSALAGRLLLADRSVVVFDVDPARLEAADRSGCTKAASVAGVIAEDPALVLLSLPTAMAFRSCIGAVAAACAERPAGATTVVDTSTLDVATKEEGRDALAAVGTPLLDCPVSGIASQAAVGDVVVYASGPDDVLDRCEEVLRLISRAVFRVGDFGVGSKTKLLANMLVGIHNTAAAEMLAAAARAGLDPEPTLAAIASGAGGSRMLDKRGPMMISGDYGDGATVDLFRKDLRLIQSFMTEIGARTPLLDVVSDLYDEVADSGFAQVDPAIVYAAYTKEDHPRDR